jgi:hypothetical protein
LGGIDSNRPSGAFPSAGEATAAIWSRASRAAFAPVDALMAFAAFNANQALTAQIGLAHSFANALQGQAAFTEAGARSLAAGPVRNVVDGAANLQAEYARHVAQVAQTFGRHFGRLAFAFPAARPFH